MIQNCGSIKSQTVTEVWRNLFIWTIVSCITMNLLKKIKVPGMTTVKKLVYQTSHLMMQQKSTGSQWSCLRICDATGYLLRYVTILESVFCIHYSLHMLKLDRFLKRELQLPRWLLTKALDTRITDLDLCVILGRVQQPGS